MTDISPQPEARLPTVALVVLDRFSPFHVSVPCIVFEGRMYDRQLFDLRVCAGEPGPLTSTLGMSIDTPYGLEGLADADVIILPYWRDPAEEPSPALAEALREANARGAQIVGLCLGTYLLAYCGLLDGRRASTHWEFEQDFLKRFPQIKLDTNALYVEDGNLLTSAGTGAGLDCCIHLVRQHYGSEIANQVARRMVIPPHREGGQAQFISQPVPASTRDATINGLLDFLRANLDRPHDLDELAERTHMSRRTFTRQFRKATGQSVGNWLLSERLQHCQTLLESTDHDLDHIAALVGFQSATSLRQHFKSRFGLPPAAWRKTFAPVA